MHESTQSRVAWVRAAAALFGVAWGANHFTPLLLVYRGELGLPGSAVTSIFGIYAVGLVPALIFSGRAADRYGRRAVLRPAMLVSVLATLVLMLGPVWWPSLYVGRFLAGVASGAAYSAGTAWVTELSTPGRGARRSAAALSLGFGIGPLLAGALAQWLPWPVELPYVVHLALMAGVLVLAWRVPETAPALARAERAQWLPRPAVSRHFLLGVVPWAPWVFGTVAISIATLPALLPSHTASAISTPVAFSGLVGGLTLPLGALVQPIARRLAHAGHLHAPVAGLLVTALGLAGTALVAWRPVTPLVLVTAVVLGTGYGILMVTGLDKVERMAEQHEFAGLVSIFYALAYLGFAAPYLLAALAGGASYALWLVIAALTTLATIPLMMLGGQPLTLPSADGDRHEPAVREP
ncbi:MFS transporter [Amycolatopsis sp. DSM 110486]|uniref:MFS transporter n=1 Tax=Amycolatopsis sp. DSM 110486 TaxID=2865832 RepID=UPI001C6A7E81|nr:MFS transporter [Amycolatopsis sp. DSM 110486]QYN22063.1 MFS transporter [Amycolatopsis sp. DSM 110486]